MFLIFDTETTGLPRDFNAPITDKENWPRLVQLAWQLHDEKGELVEVKNFIVKPEGFTIPYNAEKIHGISTKRAEQQGMPLDFVLEEFNKDLGKAQFNVGHNIGFDINIMGCEYYRKGIETPLMDKGVLDTKDELTAAYCELPGGRGGKFKWPTLTELHEKLFGEGFDEAHNAAADVEATARCFLELVRIDVFGAPKLGVEKDLVKAFREHNPKPFELIGLNIQPYLPDDVELDAPVEKKTGGPSKAELKQNLAELQDVAFSHLHNHSQYSILQATTEIGAMVGKAAEHKMPAIALTDLGNMMAAFQFVKAIEGHNKKANSEEETDLKPIKPIVGCELFVCRNHTDKSVKDNGFQIPILAKNKKGYHNLAKLSSFGYIDGFYYVPRVDKDLITQYKEDLIVLTGGLMGEIPSLILNVGEEQAEESFVWWKEQFGADFYVELIRHGLEEEDRVNEVLLRFCEKYDVKCIAANNSFYLNKEDANAHDILLCVKEGQKKSTPIGRGRGFRFGFPNDEFYLKTPDEMKTLFKDLPESISNIKEVIDKVEPYTLQRDVLLPKFEIPEQFVDPEDDKDGGKRGENAYLKHLTYVGAEKRYGEITDEIKERLDFELETIERTGYPGYFLIVQDFCAAARDMGVSVGPGRGSAAGSAVAYCIGITNVDPIEYDLLFERFLNPDRVSLPDIDIDFDDEGRGKVIDYVIDKYGASQVAQIITYGTMAAKSSIRDTGRVLDLPLPDTDRIAKLVPDVKLNKLFSWDEETRKKKLSADQQEMANELMDIFEQKTLEGETVQQAKMLEGSVRNTGIHACGVIITPSDIRDHVPIAVSKDSSLWCTQFDNSVVENAGLLKMDFLGLKTLTLIKDAIAIIKERHGVEIDPDEIPLDDVPTYELFQRGETIGVFQYESAGMQKYLKELKPSAFADLIAMNALYRPGPLEYIPSFIKRKHGEEEIEYDLDDMEEYLKETYGITVYQEQVMLLSQKLAGFTKGQADMLRKAMGKKIFKMLQDLKPLFLNGGKERGHDTKKLEKIWKDWEAFASYAFNKSHSTCYAWVAFQTAYLKANYPAEYMASVLSNNMNNITDVTFFMEECRRMGVPVLGPDVNESVYKFTVNAQGEIRFGLGGIKGVGEGPVRAILEERESNGGFDNVFDFVKRVDLKSVNKKAMESLALAGAFDELSDGKRAWLFAEDIQGSLFLEKVMKFGAAFQSSAANAANTLFGEEHAVEVPEPAIPDVEDWGNLKRLSKEKEVIGIYISGHPLDDFSLEIKHFCNRQISSCKNLNGIKGVTVKMAGVITEAAHRLTKRGQPFGMFTVEDYSDAMRFFVFSDDYLKFKQYLVEGWFVYMEGRAMPRKYQQDELEFKISRMELLSDLRDKLAKEINISVHLNDVRPNLIDEIELLCEENKGPCKVRLIVEDEFENRKIKVEMPSKSKSVKLTNDLIDQLKLMPAVDFELK